MKFFMFYNYIFIIITILAFIHFQLKNINFKLSVIQI